MHVTFNDVSVHLTEEEWRNLNRGQLQLYMDVMNENYASLRSLGLPVPESHPLPLMEQQKWGKRPSCEAEEESYIPRKTASNGLGESISPTSGRSTEKEVNGCAPTDPNQKVPEPLPKKQDSLASFKKKMLYDSSLEPKCAECKGILRCYCESLRQKRRKPYACDDCGKAYRQEMYLLLHHKSHFRDNFYKCTLCEKSFDKAGVLQKHMKTHRKLTRPHLGSFQEDRGTPQVTRPEAMDTPEDTWQYVNGTPQDTWQTGMGTPQHPCQEATAAPQDPWQKATAAPQDPWQKATAPPKDQWQKATAPPKDQWQATLHSCKQCDAVFLRKALLRIHSREHKKAKARSCLMCGLIVQTYGELNLHLKGHKKPYECTLCGKLWTNRPGFMAHLREHSGEQLHKCKFCTKGYRRLSSFIKHMKVHLSQVGNKNNPKPDQPSLLSTQELGGAIKPVFHRFSQKEVELGVTCLNVCPSTQKVDVDPAKETEQTIAVCNERPIEFKPLKKGRRITCKKCKKRFRYRESFRRHRESHRVRFTCHHCGQVYRKLVKLYLHRRGHTKYRPYMCKHCTKTFSFRSLIFLHLHTHDPSEKSRRYPCAYCSKVFKSQANCIVHQKTHKCKPAESPTDSYLDSFSNIEITPLSDHDSAEKSPLQEMPPSKVYVQRLCYRPCV